MVFGSVCLNDTLDVGLLSLVHCVFSASLCKAAILKGEGLCYHLDKCQIFSTYSQIPSFPFSIPSPLHPIPHSLAVSSLLPPSLHPCSFLSQMGLCDAEGHRNVSLTYTQPLRLSRFLPPCFTHSHFLMCECIYYQMSLSFQIVSILTSLFH